MLGTCYIRTKLLFIVLIVMNVSPDFSAAQFVAMPFSSYGGFSQQPAFGFQSQPQPLSRTSSSTNDMQATSQMSIDLSAAEFPSLTNRNIPQPQSMAASRVNYGKPLVIVELGLSFCT